MTDIATRNREVKRRLEAEFGSGKVRVRNGRGTSYGWCKISIDVTPLDPEEARELHRRAARALDGIEFGKYYADDGYGTEAKSRSITFNHSRYRSVLRGEHGTYAWPWEDGAEALRIDAAELSPGWTVADEMREKNR